MLRNNQVDCCIVAGIIEALISVNSPAYHPSNWARTLLTILVVTVVAAFNTVAASHLSFLEGVFATCHVFALVPVCVTLWVLVTPKPSVGEALGHIVDYTGSWATAGLSALVGQKVAILSTIRYSAIGQMAEEVKGASEVVPYGMVWSFVLNIPLTVTMLVTYTFNIGSVDAAIQSPYAFVYVFHNATQSAQATTAFTLIIMLLMLIITASTMAVTTRQAFAFAHHGGLPFSQWLTRISRRFGVPLNAILLTAAITSVLTLVNTASNVALDTMLSLSASSMMAVYALSIGCITMKRVRKEALPRGWWPLGKKGMAINCTALLYAIWASFWPLWPLQANSTTSDFNWASVFFVTFMGFA